MALVGESADALPGAPMLVVEHAERWLVNHRQVQRPADLGNGDFFSMEEEVSVEKPARFKVSPGKDKERAVGSVDGFRLRIVV